MKPEIIHATNLDANESAFFSQELRHVKSRTYDVLYPEFTAPNSSDGCCHPSQRFTRRS